MIEVNGDDQESEDRSTAARVEEACLNGWPSLAAVLLDGWLLRFAEGHTKRANSVNVIAPARQTGSASLARKIAACEALYAARGLPTIFSLSSAAPQDGLEAALDAAGYGPPLDDSLVLLCDSLSGANAAEATVRLNEATPPRAWLDAFARISGLDERAATLHARILDALVVPAACAAVEAPDGTIGAVAFGAVHDGLVCINSVATAREHRGRGLAGHAVAAAMAWARNEAGADAACLPVGAANAAALALYRRLGFTREVSRYHYRVAPPR